MALKDDRLYLLAVAVSPAALKEEERLHRYWSVRTLRVVPVDAATMAAETVQGAKESVIASLSEFYSESQLLEAMPTVHIDRIDDHHLIARVSKLVGAHDEIGMAGMYAVLRHIDLLVTIEDLQGLPKSLWPLIFGSAS